MHFIISSKYEAIIVPGSVVVEECSLDLVILLGMSSKYEAIIVPGSVVVGECSLDLIILLGAGTAS